MHAPPLNLIDYAFFFIPFCIRMLKNKAKIAWESIKNPESRKGLRVSRSWYAFPQKILDLPLQYQLFLERMLFYFPGKITNRSKYTFVCVQPTFLEISSSSLLSSVSCWFCWWWMNFLWAPSSSCSSLILSSRFMACSLPIKHKYSYSTLNTGNIFLHRLKSTIV